MNFEQLPCVGGVQLRQIEITTRPEFPDSRYFRVDFGENAPSELQLTQFKVGSSKPLEFLRGSLHIPQARRLALDELSFWGLRALFDVFSGNQNLQRLQFINEWTIRCTSTGVPWGMHQFFTRDHLAQVYTHPLITDEKEIRELYKQLLASQDSKDAPGAFVAQVPFSAEDKKLGLRSPGGLDSSKQLRAAKVGKRSGSTKKVALIPPWVIDPKEIGH